MKVIVIVDRSARSHCVNRLTTGHEQLIVFCNVAYEEFQLSTWLRKFKIKSGRWYWSGWAVCFRFHNLLTFCFSFSQSQPDVSYSRLNIFIDNWDCVKVNVLILSGANRLYIVIVNLFKSDQTIWNQIIRPTGFEESKLLTEINKQSEIQYV